MKGPGALPYLTADLPGVGGQLRAEPEDFVVDELPAYEPSGTGEHIYLRIEKRDRNTADVVRGLAAALGLSERDIGYAGRKDRRAVTRQWISLPPGTDQTAAEAVELDGVRVLEASRHTNKLRTGHLRGNRFDIVLRDLAVEPDRAVDAAERILDVLRTAPGSPNWFGEQRFGREGDNAQRGLALLRGGGKRSRGRQLRFLISALQSQLFNDLLEDRIGRDEYRVAVVGDVLKKRETGGMFECADADVDSDRLRAGELVVTGPMFGHKMRTPTAGSVPFERERELLSRYEIDAESFRKFGKLAVGTRRALSVVPADATARACHDNALRVSFSLPAGAYATAVLRELRKPSPDPESRK